MTLSLIGAGFGRTGTNSMKLALTRLGLGPCHHMTVLLDNPEHQALWDGFARGATPDWDKAFSGFRSAVDWPSAYYWRELIAFYPEAKVILTHRTAESWWASFEKTILVGLSASTDPQSLGLALIRDKVFGGKIGDKAHAIACYEANVKAVRETIPAPRLLVHELGDGWEPLCAHLGVPVPGVAYPSSNNAEAFKIRHLQSPEVGHLN